MSERSVLTIQTNRNRIRIAGGVRSDFRRILAALHNLTSRAGYQDIVLDFSGCDSAFPGGILPVCAQVMALRAQGIDTELVLPDHEPLLRLFQNAGWAHLIDPEHYPRSSSRSATRVPVSSFTTPADQKRAVDKSMDAILSSMSFLDRGDLESVEWSINEVSDNVLVHSQSEIGGLLQLMIYPARQRVEFVVVDAGVGIPATLLKGHPNIRSDAEALEFAIREGVTRDASIGQGNGLFGSFKVAQVSSGYFYIHSGFAHLDYDAAKGLRIRTDPVPYTGSMVIACLDCSNPSSLGEALRFGESKSTPFGYVEERFDPDLSGELVFAVQQEAESFGSRVAGEPLRKKLLNLVHLYPGKRIKVDFDDIALISSSFADEVIGKLFVELGPVAFMRSIEIQNVSATVRSLVDRAILQRSQTSR